MYLVSVTIHVLPEHRAAFIAASRDNAEHSRNEPGCRQFDVGQHVEDETCFHL